jgi:hypothetical protein
MTTERKPYPSFTDDEIDEATLDRIAHDKRIGTMVMPKPASREGASRKAALPAAPDALPDHLPTPRSGMRNVNTEMPEYLGTELKVRAAQDRTSIRFLIMNALSKDGFDVRPADLEEARGGRSGDSREDH